MGVELEVGLQSVANMEPIPALSALRLESRKAYASSHRHPLSGATSTQLAMRAPAGTAVVPAIPSARQKKIPRHNTGRRPTIPLPRLRIQSPSKVNVKQTQASPEPMQTAGRSTG